MVPRRDSLLGVLKDSTRQRILLLLQKQQPLTYSELMTQTEVSNTGRFNYHLKILADFLEKSDDGKYRLTEKGFHAAQLLTNGSTWNLNGNGKTDLKSTVLIGTFGCALVLLNPIILQNFLGIPLVVGLWPSISTTLYGFLVPGAFMYLLCNRCFKNREIQNLIKAPLFSILLLVCFVVVFALTSEIALLAWGIRIGFPPLQTGASVPQTIIQKTGTQAHATETIQQTTYSTLSIPMLPFAGIYSLVGFLLASAIQRFRALARS
jgi:hypothetical protein